MRSLLILLLFFGNSAAMAQERDLLYSKSLSPRLQRIVAAIRNPKSGRVDEERLNQITDFFVRIAPRSDILTKDNQLLDESNQGQKTAILGTKPFIFLTSPESIYGRSLLEIYTDIGYEAEDIIRRQHNQDVVAIIFRYPENVTLAQDLKDGILPKDWNEKVYISYWDNIFSLFYRLAENANVEPDKRGEFAPERTFFRSEAEKSFVLNYTVIAKHRLKKVPYAELKATGGGDWAYRKLLEDKLSIFEHFRGNGRTQNEVADPDGEQLGIVEFVGPNRKIKDLPEVAIVHLGKLIIEDTYTKKK